MATYVYDREKECMVDKATREPMLSETERARPLQTPLTYGDIPGYRSPIDGKWIEGRRARQYDMQKNNCIDANDMPRATNGKLRNAKFAAKHGVSHMVEK
jgi:hypothetical protein